MLPDDMYNKYANGERPLFRHLYGSSWHGDDAKSVLWVLHHPIFLALLTLTGSAPLLVRSLCGNSASACWPVGWHNCWA